MTQQPRSRCVGFTIEEDVSMLKYLLETETVGGPRNMWKDFMAKTGTEKNVYLLNNRFKHTLSPNLHIYDQIAMEEKVQLYQKYGIPVHEDFRALLIDGLGLQINEQGYIVNDEEEEGVVDAAPAEEEDVEEVAGPAPKPASALRTARASKSRRAASKRGRWTKAPAAAAPRPKRARFATPLVQDPVPAPAPEIQAPAPAPAPDVQVHQPAQWPQIDMNEFRTEIKTLIVDTVVEIMPECLSALKRADNKVNPKKNAKIDARGCLKDLKALVKNLKSAKMTGIEKRIDNAILHSSEVEPKLNVDAIQGIVDLALKTFGH